MQFCNSVCTRVLHLHDNALGVYFNVCTCSMSFISVKQGENQETDAHLHAACCTERPWRSEYIQDITRAPIKSNNSCIFSSTFNHLKAISGVTVYIAWVGVHNSEGSRNPGGDIWVLEQNADDSFLEEGLFNK